MEEKEDEERKRRRGGKGGVREKLIKMAQLGLERWFSIKSRCCSPEDQVRLSAPTGWLTTIHNSGSKRSNTFCPLWASGAHGVHIHKCRQNNHIHKINKS